MSTEPIHATPLFTAGHEAPHEFPAIERRSSERRGEGRRGDYDRRDDERRDAQRRFNERRFVVAPVEDPSMRREEGGMWPSMDWRPGDRRDEERRDSDRRDEERRMAQRRAREERRQTDRRGGEAQQILDDLDDLLAAGDYKGGMD